MTRPKDASTDQVEPTAPDGRVPSSYGYGTTIKPPGPEGFDPRAYETTRQNEPSARVSRRDEDIFPDLDAADGAGERTDSDMPTT